MTTPDVLLLVLVGLFALSGFFRGFAAQFFWLAGVVGGLLAGAWIAPHLLPDGGRSPWLPLVSLLGAATGAVVVGLAAGRLAVRLRAFLAVRPALRVVDRAGGAATGAVLGLALAWLAAVLFLQQSALGLRRAVQDSSLLPALVSTVPPEPVLRALDRFDPLPLLPALAPRALPPPDASVLRSPGARAAAASVVKVEGTSCGLAVQGSGWVVRRGIVATNTHVIAGQDDTHVLVPSGETIPATSVYVDGVNDVSLLRVPSLTAPPLRIDRSTTFPARVILVGYPRDGPLTASAGTAGGPRGVLAPDAYGRHVRSRTVIPLRGRVQPGESGGPVVDRRGAVLAMIFGGTRRGEGGFGVPVELVVRGLRRMRGPVATGPCVG